MSEIVFVLGAGASVSAGVPTMTTFFDRLGELSRTRRENIDGHIQLLLNSRALLQQAHSKAKLDLNNLEAVFGAFDMASVIGGLNGLPTDDLLKLPTAVRRAIAFTIEESMECPVENKKILPPRDYLHFARMIKKLNPNRQQARCSVITFNYDLGLDYAMHFCGMNPNYALPNTTSTSPTNLFKLHGSLNWARCSKCAAVILWQLGDYFRRIQYDLMDDPKKVRLSVAKHLSTSGIKHCQDAPIETDPYIVPPTWNKASQHAAISTVWQGAAAALADAESIYICGYSIPAADEFFKYLFSIGSIGVQTIRRFVVINPDSSSLIQDRYRSLVGTGIDGRFEYRQSIFSNALDAIAKDLGIEDEDFD